MTCRGHQGRQEGVCRQRELYVQRLGGEKECVYWMVHLQGGWCGWTARSRTGGGLDPEGSGNPRMDLNRARSRSSLMARCQVKLTREGESKRPETQSQRPLHSLSGPWTAEERPGWGRSALTEPRPLTMCWGLQGRSTLQGPAVGTLLCNLPSLAQPHPMAPGRAVPGHAHLTPPPCEPFSSAAPFPEPLFPL